MLSSEWWQYQPWYQLTLTDLHGRTFNINTLATCQANIDTGGTVGQGIFTIYDPDWEIWRNVQPRAMFEINLVLADSKGEQEQAWNGYIDEANKIDDPQSGQQLVFTCTSPQKLFEVKPQTPSQASNMAVAMALGVTGSAIVRYAADKVGYPATKLRIDSSADSGANTWGALSAGDFTNPTSSSWSAILQGLLADSGLEMFFDAYGNLVWRPIAYLNVPADLLSIDLSQVGHYDVGYGDRGVVTTVEVRYGNVPFHVVPSNAAAAYWQAPAEMTAALGGTRYYTMTAPYISSNQNGAATYLAKAIGQMSAANVATSTIIQVANPFFKPGNVYEIPSNDPREGPMLGYLSSKALNLQYKGPWIEVDGFTYLRQKGQSFPYGLKPTKPVQPVGPDSGYSLSQHEVADTYSDNMQASPDGGQVTTPFNLTQDATIVDGKARVDPSLGIGLGAQIQIFTALSGKNKKPIGDKAIYTVVSDAGTDGTIHLTKTDGNTNGYIVVLVPGAQSDSSSSSPASPGAPGGSKVPDQTNIDGTKLPTPDKFPRFPAIGYTMANIPVSQEWHDQEYSFEYQYTYRGIYYAHFHTGIDFAIPVGTVLVAPFDGVVTYAAWDDTGYGWRFSMQAGKVSILYGHTMGQFKYGVGQFVKAGTPVAISNGAPAGPINNNTNPGNSTGAHVHFGVYDGNTGYWENPRNYL